MAPTAATIRLSGLTALPLALAAVVGIPILLVDGALIGIARAVSGTASVPGIPPDYLALYRVAAAEYRLGADGWSVLAAVGKIECDHGGSSLRGCHRGEANSAGARGPAQFLPNTWEVYGVDGNGDGTRDVYEPADAIFGMANYLRASGAPGDWRRALFAYNHAGWYVDDVLRHAVAYRESATVALASPRVLVAGAGGAWLIRLPGFVGERCDARIVPDVTALVRAFPAPARSG